MIRRLVATFFLLTSFSWVVLLALGEADGRVAPANGLILGGVIKIDVQKQLDLTGAKAHLAGASLQIDFPGGSKDSSVSLKPTDGAWDLRQYLQVTARVKNVGGGTGSPRLRLESAGGPTDWATPPRPLGPGATADVVIPFASSRIWDGTKDSGTSFTSDAVSRVVLSAETQENAFSIEVESIQAGVPRSPVPDWLGKRPPVDGEWVRTFDDELNGSAVDASKWDIYGENYYDNESHFSKANVIVGGGVARIRFEKKRGHQNDNPIRRPETLYATGFLTTFGKWSQRYGYFESRMKLPTAPGLWPAFWMMPDRGAGVAGPARQETTNGGMEFDIMEQLTRWGPYRYNIAMHWDGYAEKQKFVSSEHIYFQPDADGYITAGLLWTPGSLVYYANGRAVLRWTNPRVSNVPAVFLFTLPTGGWDNNALDDTKLPDDFVIDYVRAWQRKDLASPSNSK